MANILLEQAFKALEDVKDIEISAKDLYESKEEVDLPKEVKFTASEVGLDTDSLADEDEYISEILSDLLSDTYGFCHYGFDYEVVKNEKGEPSEFICKNIKWDTTESLDKYITEEDDLKESCSDADLIDKLVAFGSCDTEEEAEKRVSRMSQEMKDEMCKSLSAQAKDHLLNDSLKEEKHVCEKCGKEVCECDKLQEGPNTTTTISVLDDGEKVIKQSGYSALTKKVVNGKPVYRVKYAPGYYVKDIEAKHDKEAISRFLGLNEGVNKELEYDYYVVSYGNPYKAIVLNSKEDAVQTAKNFNADPQKEGKWEVYHYTKPYDGELKYDIIKEELEEVAREEYCVLVNGNNEECFNDEVEAIKFARKRFAEEGNDSVVKVLLVKYGPKDEHGDEVELGFETIWASKFDESLKEYIEPKEPYKVCKDTEYYVAEYSPVEKEISSSKNARYTIVTKKVGDKEFGLGSGSGLDFASEEEAKKEIDKWCSLKEELSKDEKSISEEHKEDDKVVCAKCGSEEVKFNDPETKEPLCADCFEKRSTEFEEEVLGKDKLDESITVNINDEEEVKKAKEEIEKSEKADDEYEQIVDVDAESIDELKDSYVGNVILVCEDCLTPRFIKPELLKKDEETGLYNVGEACPHCGSEKGYKAEGQVAKASVEVDVEKTETTGASEPEVKEEEKVEVEEKEEKPLPSAMESKEEPSRLEKVDLNEQRFDRLVNKFVHTTYENVENYKTNSLYLDDDNSLIVEGVITYKSGKEKEAHFKLVEKKLSTAKEDVIALTGICEAFNTCEKAFTFRGNLRENKLDLNSLTYNFTTKVLNESKNIKGKVCIKY